MKNKTNLLYEGITDAMASGVVSDSLSPMTVISSVQQQAQEVTQTMASNIIKWYKNVFGEELLNCKELANDNGDKNMVSVDVLFDKCFKNHSEDCKLVIGLYFSPIEIGHDETTNYLIQLYHLINYGCNKSSNSNVFENNLEMNQCKHFIEVIQVFLANSIHWLDRCTIDESKVLEQLRDLPWYAVPVKDRERVIRLTRKYQIKSLTPSLVLLNGRTGKIITKHGKDRLLEDPMGLNFPWKPRPLHTVLQNIELHPGGKNPNREITSFQNLRSSIIGFYFSAHWCPPCKGFTPQLIETYKILNKVGSNFEIIFVSSDRSPESQKLYSEIMPWLIVPFSEENCRRELASLFGVQGIPTLVIVDTDGSVITYDGRGEINDDPTGQLFPWRPRLVNILTERQSAKLQDSPAVVLFVEKDDTEMEFAETVLSPAVKEFTEKYQNDELPLEFFIACDSDTSDTLREFIGIDDAVPLLALINIPDGTWSVLEEGAEISEDSVKEFVSKFINKELPVQSICSDYMNTGNT